MKRILILAAFGLLVAGQALATVSATQTREEYGGIMVITLKMPSQAQNAIDTSYVSLKNAAWSQLPNSTIANSMVILEATIGASFGASQDSVNTQIGYSLDGVLWTDEYSLANTGSNLTTTAPQKAIQFTKIAPLLRIIVKNVDATAGAAKVSLAYPTKQ